MNSKSELIKYSANKLKELRERKMSGNRGSHGHEYYHCKGAIRDTFCKNIKWVKDKELENYLKNNILILLEQHKIEIKKINTQKEEKKVDISKLKNKLNKLVELYTNELIDLEHYKKEYYSLNNEIERIEKENKKIEKFDTSKIEKLLTSNLFEMYDKLENLEKRRLWASIISYIEVKNGNDFTIHFIQ